jgi:superfamily II DNA or RNA helicase
VTDRPPVTLLRSGNRLVVRPTTPEVHDLLAPLLTYVETKHHHGQEAGRRRRLNLSPVEEITWECYGLDHRDRIGTSFGFADLITAALTRRGHAVTLRYASAEEADLAAERDRTVYRPNWAALDELTAGGFEFLYKQREALELLAARECGRFDCPTGWGKGTLIMLACKVFNRAKIAVVSKNGAVIDQRLYPELAANLPSVGVVGGGRRVKGRRVTCYYADSLHHADGDEDFVFVDEGHQACADYFAASLARFDHARMFGFSASWDMRLDNKDLRAMAMFGPIRLSIPYQEAVDHGLVLPIEIFWDDVVTDLNPCAGVDRRFKSQLNEDGIWTHDYRNEVVAAAARSYKDDAQTLITVTTLEHALHLRRHLPDYEIVYAGESQTPQRLRYFRDQGLLYDGFSLMTPERRQRLTRQYSRGKLRKVIVTTCWNAGVDFRHLEVLVRADAGGSPINDVQLPGRNSRHHREAGRKSVGIVRDFLDQFDSGFHQKAKKREKTYHQMGWTQHYPDAAGTVAGRLRQLMGGQKTDGKVPAEVETDRHAAHGGRPPAGPRRP